MRQELCGLDLGDGIFDQLAELAPLLFADGAAQLLDLRQALAYKDHEGDLGLARKPRVTS